MVSPKYSLISSEEKDKHDDISQLYSPMAWDAFLCTNYIPIGRDVFIVVALSSEHSLQRVHIFLPSQALGIVTFCLPESSWHQHGWIHVQTPEHCTTHALMLFLIFLQHGMGQGYGKIKAIGCILNNIILYSQHFSPNGCFCPILRYHLCSKAFSLLWSWRG